MDEVYICADIETDGHSPGHHSMLSLASVAFKLDKTVVGTFERNLDPLPNARQAPDTMKFWADNPVAWAACRVDPVTPVAAMQDYAIWLSQFGPSPVLVAHPIGFDYTFIHWYLYEFTGNSPLYPAGLDVASYAMAVTGRPFRQCHRRHLPINWAEPDLPHTHKAIDDAMGHAMFFCNMVAAHQRRQSGIAGF